MYANEYCTAPFTRRLTSVLVLANVMVKVPAIVVAPTEVVTALPIGDPAPGHVYICELILVLVADVSVRLNDIVYVPVGKVNIVAVGAPPVVYE